MDRLFEVLRHCVLQLRMRRQGSDRLFEILRVLQLQMPLQWTWPHQIMSTTREGKIPRGRPARRWRDELDDYWMGTIWQRIAKDRHNIMWKQHVEAFAQPRDTMAAQRWR